MKKAINILVRLVAVVVVAGLPMATSGLPARSQSSAPILKIDSCDNFNYPEVTCEVNVIDAQGLPVDGLEVDKFEVADARGLAKVTFLTQTISAKAQLSNMLVLDFGSDRGLGLDAVREYGKKMLQETANNDFVGLVGIGGPIDFGTSTQPPLTEGREYGFSQAGEKRNDIINLIVRFTPPTVGSGSYPVYEAVCKALQLSSRQSVGTRAIILVSDGIDDVSRSVCTKPDDVISEAVRFKIPIYTILTGQRFGSEETLKTLARRTGGVALGRAANAEEVVSRYREIQNRLKRRYVISFIAAAPADNRDSAITISATVSGQRASDTMRVVSLFPRKPLISDVRISANGVPVPDWRATPLMGTVIITPVLQARKVAQVVYTINGVAQLSEESPYALTIRTDALAAGLIQIPIRLVGELDHAIETTSYATLTLTIGAVEGQPTRAPSEAGPTPAGSPPRPATTGLDVPSWLYFVIGGVALAAIIGAVIVVKSMRQGNASEGGTDDPTRRHRSSVDTERTPGVESGTTGRLTTRPDSIPGLTPDGSGQEESKTQRLSREATGRYRKPVARLSVKSGKSAGSTFDLGTLLECKIGREVDRPAGHIYVESVSGRFVSRHHASVLRRDDVLILVPRSTNSDTLVNGNIVPVGQELAIKAGDKIEFGDVVTEVIALQNT